MKNTETNLARVCLRNHMIVAEATFLTETYGADLAKTNHVPPGLDAKEAIHNYLIQKHHWNPQQLHDMTWPQLRECLLQEISAWTPPQEALAVLAEHRR